MIFITGATGNNSGELVKPLLAPDVEVQALVRNRLKAIASLAAQLSRSKHL